jgi:transglutaminase-like putative cysteine protease
VISAKPTFEQESDVPAQLGNPVFVDRKVKRLSISGVAPGTIVDWSYTTEELSPYMPGDFQQSWRITTGNPVLRSRLIVDVPSDLKLRIKESNLDFKRVTTTSGGHTVHTWARQDIPRIESEPYAADSNSIYQYVSVSSPMEWNYIASWYADHARNRYQLTPALEDTVARLVAGAPTRVDSIRRIHRWVAQDIRYVSIALGMGGYQPRTPEEVLRTGYGDCKDKATLFVAALRYMGMDAWPVLLNAFGGVERSLPSLSQLNHAIAAVRVDGGYHFTDLTSSLTPYGELPPGEEGEFGLVVLGEDASEVVTLPQSAVEDNKTEYQLTGTLGDDGLVTAWFQEKHTGAMQYDLRGMLENPMDSASRETFAKALARGFFPDAGADSLTVTNGKDLSVAPSVRVKIVNGRGLRSAGGLNILELPFGNMGALGNVATALSERPARRFPIDATLVTGDDLLVQEYRLELPVGWKARLPKNVSATGPFGNYSVNYAQEGREFRFTRRFSGARGVLAPDRMPELIRWLAEVGTDDAEFVILDGGEGT